MWTTSLSMFPLTGCGDYKITHSLSEPISGNQFSFTGSFYASGTFTSNTAANGTDGLSSFNIPGCGVVSGGPWTWNATWKNSSQPTSLTADAIGYGVSPASISLTSGTGSGNISIDTIGNNIQLIASANGKQGQSNAFNVQNIISLPGAFSKSTPSTGSTGHPTNPTLTWGTSSGATSYEYCIDTTNSGTCDSGIWTSTGTNTSVTLSGLDSGTTYYWQVKAGNSAGPTDADGGTWWSFTTSLKNLLYLPIILR